jgi:hypothetical protein
MDLVGFIGLGNKLDAQCRDTRTGVAHTECPRISTQHVWIEWQRCRIGNTMGLQRT